MRLLRTLAPVACVLAVAVSHADRITAVSGQAARTVLHRAAGEDNVFCRLYLDPHDKFTSVGPPPQVAAALTLGAVEAAANANITVNYLTGFNGPNGPAAQAAFQAAVDIWKTQISSGVPIVIDAEFKDLCGGVPSCGLLGQASSGALTDVEAPQPHTYYPYPLLNKIAGFDVGANYFGSGESNISAEFNNNGVNWYFGTDGHPTAGTVDFESVVLHELGHGLGFVGVANVTGATGTIGSGGIPYIYDTFVSDSSGVSVVTGYANGSTALGSLLVGGGDSGSQTTGTFWNGAQGVAANIGIRPKLYAPSPFEDGSSHSHLDEKKYPAGNLNSLMTPQLGLAESIHTPGPIMLGMFADMGWLAGNCSFALDRSSATVPQAGGSLSVTLTTSSSCNWTASITSGSSFVSNLAPTSGSGSATISMTVAANSGFALRTATISIGGLTFTISQNGTGPVMSLDKASLIFSAVSNGSQFTSQTQTQAVRLTQSGAGTVTWVATSSVPWLRVANASGTAGPQATGSGSATLNISVAFQAALQSTESGSISLTFTNAGNSAGPIAATLNIVSPASAAVPFGAFDTPANNSTGITGSIAVTGWALDDIGVSTVRVMRSPQSGESPTHVIQGQPLVFIGNAVLVDGARSDVATLFPTLPRNTFAGWGYLMLTNFLPNLGNGTFVLTAVADDADGHSTILGTKTIVCDNAHINTPFGAIDTPVQGGTVSGTMTNFGWVLAPGPAYADPPDGGTVRILIDGAIIPTVPAGWTNRSDLTALFPSGPNPTDPFPGIAKALGVAGIDTMSLSNGVHTIAWLVTDSFNRAAGIGSRYFTVSNGALYLAPSQTLSQRSAVLANPAQLTMPRAAAERLGESHTLTDEVASARPLTSVIRGRRGYDVNEPLRTFTSARTGLVTIQSEELDRIELHLGAAGYSGYLRVPGGLAPLPIGAALSNDGIFTWMPGVGFVGTYDLVFVRWAGGRAVTRQDVRIVLNVKGSGRVGPQTVIDYADGGLVAGWAADLDSDVDGGVDTVHVWAYPVGGGDPIFLGAAAYGGKRPDVAAVYGDRFEKTGYGIFVRGLEPGDYDLAVFAYSTVKGGFGQARTARVTVR